MGSTDKRSSFSVKIIGAGIAGLSAGLAIARKGHKVTIYEYNTSLSEYGAGIQLSPNATRNIYSWGIEEGFLKLSNQPEVMTMRRYADNSVLGEIPHNPISEWEFGYPWWQVHRPDMQMLLAAAATKAGVEIKFGYSVASVDVEKGTMTFQDGSTIEADLILAADGINSRTRTSIPANAGVKPKPFHEFCFRAVIFKEKMNSDPETAQLMLGQDSLFWMGPGSAVLGYTISGGEKYSTLVTCPRPSDAPLAGWNEPGDPNEARELVKNFCPAVRKIWDHVDDCAKWTLGELPPLPSYVSESGKFVLIGDAAHAIVPHLGQGGAQALDDAASIAEFVSSAHTSEELAKVMRSFQDFRQPRIENIRRMALGNASMVTMEDGPEQEARDKAWGGMTTKFKRELADLGEEGFKKKPKAKAEPGDNMRSPESRQYLYAYDAAHEAKMFLEAR